MLPQFNIIAAACENMGIGFKGDLPWRLKEEMAYFTKMTSSTKDLEKKNAVIMGRLTWNSIPPKYKPLPGRVNIVISKTLKENKDAIIFGSFKDALNTISNSYVNIETIWVIGGAVLYKEALSSDFCRRIYLTKIHKSFDCDTFFPQIPSSFSEIKCADVPTEIQKENGISYEFKVYEKENKIQRKG